MLSACARSNWNENQKATIGRISGAAVNVFTASAFNANTAGILGGLTSGSIGNRMTRLIAVRRIGQPIVLWSQCHRSQWPAENSPTPQLIRRL